MDTKSKLAAAFRDGISFRSSNAKGYDNAGPQRERTVIEGELCEGDNEATDLPLSRKSSPESKVSKALDIFVATSPTRWGRSVES